MGDNHKALTSSFPLMLSKAWFVIGAGVLT